MYGIRNGFPGGDLSVIVDSRDMRISTGGRRYECCFGDKESSWIGCSLGVVFCDERQGHVGLVGAEPREGCHDNAVGEGHIADLERGE